MVLASAKKWPSKALNGQINDLNLIDTWRVYNPLVGDYTIFPHQHKKLFHVQTIFSYLADWLLSVHSIQFLSRIFSNHKTFTASSTYGNIQTEVSRWRFTSNLMEYYRFPTRLKTKLNEFLIINKIVSKMNFIKGFILKHCNLVKYTRERQTIRLWRGSNQQTLEGQDLTEHGE